MNWRMSNVVTHQHQEYSMTVGLSSNLYCVHVHVNGSSTLYGPCCQISNMSIHMHLPGLKEGVGGGESSIA